MEFSWSWPPRPISEAIICRQALKGRAAFASSEPHPFLTHVVLMLNVFVQSIPEKATCNRICLK